MAFLRAAPGVIKLATLAVNPEISLLGSVPVNFPLPSTKLTSKKVNLWERRIITFSSWIRSTPFDWNSEDDSFVVTPKLERFLFMYLNFAYVLGYEGYLVTRFVQNKLHPSETYETDNAVLKFWSLVLLTTISYQLTMLAKHNEMPGLHRRAKRWLARVDWFVDQHAELADGVANEYEKALMFCLQSDFLFTVLWVLLSILYPSQKIYLSSVIGESQDEHYFWYGCFNAVTYGYFVATWYTAVYIWVLTYIAIGMNVPTIVRIIRKSMEKEYEESFMLYREAQVMIQEFNSVCSTTIMPAVKWLTVFTITFCLYGGIVSTDLASKLLLLAFFMLILPSLQVMFRYMGEFWTESNSTIEVAQNRWRSSILGRRRARSLAPLKAKVGSCYFIDGLTDLVVFDFIVTSSVGLVVASRSE